MSYSLNVLNNLQKMSSERRGDTNNHLLTMLRLAAKWRCWMIKNTIIKLHGTEVIAGPFKGLKFLENSAEGCYVPKILGTYEQPVHDALERLIAAKYGRVINIGSAEGYYAAGLALRMPNSTVYAYDINPKAVAACKQLATRNAIKNIESRELFSTDSLDEIESGALIVCDIEGAELELLDPSQNPAFLQHDYFIESHDCFNPRTTETLTERFSKTHNIEVIRDDGMRRFETPLEWSSWFNHLDQLLSVWEWRSGPTPWLLITRKKECQASKG